MPNTIINQIKNSSRLFTRKNSSASKRTPAFQKIFRRVGTHKTQSHHLQCPLPLDYQKLTDYIKIHDTDPYLYPEADDDANLFEDTLSIRARLNMGRLNSWRQWTITTRQRPLCGKTTSDLTNHQQDNRHPTIKFHHQSNTALQNSAIESRQNINRPTEPVSPLRKHESITPNIQLIYGTNTSWQPNISNCWTFLIFFDDCSEKTSKHNRTSFKDTGTCHRRTRTPWGIFYQPTRIQQGKRIIQCLSGTKIWRPLRVVQVQITNWKNFASCRAAHSLFMMLLTFWGTNRFFPGTTSTLGYSAPSVQLRKRLSNQ